MGKNILEIYDEDYAQSYNQRFLLNDWFASDVEFEREIISKLLGEIGEDVRWLDVACGTGYFLSCFPSVERTGLDISPAMLKVAERENPGILFVEGDFKNKRPQWEGKWDIVSCMWEAYMYVESLPQLERVIENLVEWTSARGVCFLPFCDPKRLGNGEIKLPYISQNLDLNKGSVRFEAVTWSWIEKSGKQHLNMLAPQIEYMVDLVGRYFEQVEVVEYPLSKGKQRKAIIARQKKQKGVSEEQKVDKAEIEGLFSPFLKIIRASNWWLYKIPPLFAVACAEILLIDLPPIQSIEITLALLFSISSLFAYGHIVNDIFDVEVDRKVGKSNAMTERSWWQRALFCVFFVIVGFIFPVSLNFGIAASVLLGINYLLPTIYSAPPLRLKEKGIFGVISDAAGAHAIPTLFFITTFLHLNPAPQPAALIFSIVATVWAFFVGIRGILLHQLWDLDNDLQTDVKTLATESGVETVRFWMSRIIFPIELLLFGLFILLISHSTPLILVFTLFYFLLKIALSKLDSTVTFNPAPIQQSYVIPHDFYEVGLPLILATALSLQNEWFAILLLLQVILFYPSIEQRITNLVQSLRGKPQDLNSLQAQVNASQVEVKQLHSHSQQTQNELKQVQAELAKVQEELARQTSQAEVARFKAYLQHTQQGRLSLIDYYRHAITTSPDDLQLYYQVLEINPDDAQFHLQLGNALVRQGQVADAIARYQTALQFHPDNFELHFELANTLARAKQWDDAIAAYRRTIEHNPNHSLAHQHLGDALAEKGQLHEASAFYRRVLQLQSHAIIPTELYT